jgi:hypothetical protein
MTASNAKKRGSPALKKWVNELTLHGQEIPIDRMTQRIIHPGLEPITGNGFVAADAVGQIDSPGNWPQCVAIINWLERTRESEHGAFEVVDQDSAIGALFTLVADRRCQVVPEILVRVDGAPPEHRIAIPVSGQIDSALGAPMPAWEDLYTELRVTLARIASLEDDDAWAVSAAMHMHYCAALLASSDLTGAYALVVGGIESLSQCYGSPPSDWADWDEAQSWDIFIAEQQLTANQGAALRNRLMGDKHMRLSETFGMYVIDRLPTAFWQEPASLYTWAVDGLTSIPKEGGWQTTSPRAAALASDRRKLKKALKRSYQERSRFIHAGERASSFSEDVLNQIPGYGEDRLSFATLRSILRRLIFTEVEHRATSDELPPIEWHLETTT